MTAAMLWLVVAGTVALAETSPQAAPKSQTALDRQTTLIPVRVLKKDAHLEMHTRGG